MENYELFKPIDVPVGGLEKLRASLREEDEAEVEELNWLRYAVAALFIAVLLVSLPRVRLPGHNPAPDHGLMAGDESVRAFSENAAVSRLTGVSQKVQIFWLSPSAEAQPNE